MTTATNQEVHIISLKKTGPVFRNDVAEVHLFIKSRSDEGNNVVLYLCVVRIDKHSVCHLRVVSQLANLLSHTLVIRWHVLNITTDPVFHTFVTQWHVLNITTAPVSSEPISYSCHPMTCIKYN